MTSRAALPLPLEESERIAIFHNLHNFPQLHFHFTMASSCPINETYPSADEAERATISHTQKGFKISARKLPISKSDPIDKMSESLGIPVPEMIFGDNIVAIEHIKSGWRLEFNAYDALDRVDKTDKNMLKVAYSQEWTASRYGEHFLNYKLLT
jgi:type 2A phosphatase activator TIP41